MRDYFYCILIASVLSAICSSLATGGLEKYVKYVCSLICVVAVVMPVVKLIGDGAKAEFDLSAEMGEYLKQDYISAEAEKKICEHIKQTVYEKFGIYATNVSIEIYSEGNEVVVGKTTVTLDHSDEGHLEEVRDFLFETLGTTVEVVISHNGH